MRGDLTDHAAHLRAEHLERLGESWEAVQYRRFSRWIKPRHPKITGQQKNVWER